MSQLVRMDLWSRAEYVARHSVRAFSLLGIHFVPFHFVVSCGMRAFLVLPEHRMASCRTWRGGNRMALCRIVHGLEPVPCRALDRALERLSA